MTIIPSNLYPPQPNTVRAQSAQISYDAKNDRIAYPSGRSIIVRPLDPNSSETPTKQFTKHIYPTTVAAFSPSGNYIASGDESGAVKIWDTAILSGPGAASDNDSASKFDQPYIKSEFQILTGPIKSIAWDADSTRVIAVGAGKDKFGHCFTWDSGNSIGEIQGHSDTVNAVDIKPQRPYRAATVGDDKALVFYNGPPFKFDKSVRGHHSNTIRAVKFSPDGKFLVTVGSDRAIVVYDGKTGEYIKKAEDAHTGGIYGLSWYKDSQKFVTASADNTLKVWDIESLDSTKTFVVSSDNSVEHQQVSVIVANDYIISLSLDGTLNYFTEDETSRPAKVLAGHQKAITAVHYDSESHLLFTGGSDGSLLKWKVNADDATILDPIPQTVGDSKSKHSNYLVDILQLGDSTISAGWDDTIKQWKDVTLSSSTSLESGQPKHLVKTKEGKLFVLYESKVELLDASLNKIAETSFDFVSSNLGVIDDDSKILVTNETKNTVEEFSFTSSSISHSKSYPALRAPPTLIRVSPSGEYAAVSDSAGKYTLYKVSDGSVITTRWAFHSSKVIDSKWTHDSKFLISGGLDSGLFLYSVDRPAKVLKFPLAHQNGVNGVEWTSYDPEKKKGAFVTAGSDGVVKSWNVDFSAY